MISWKHSFKRLNEEFEMAKKKRQALENLLNSGRISQSTYEVFHSEIASAISEIERQQKDLLEKMNSKMRELEEQIKTLEILFANFEIQHVAGEIEEEVYQHEITLLSIGLETARRELETVRDAVNQLSNGMQIQTGEVAAEQKMEPQPSENVDVEEKPTSVVEEKMLEPPIEHAEVSETGSAAGQQQESLQTKEANQPIPIESTGEEKKEA